MKRPIMTPLMKIGAHMSIAKGILSACKTAVDDYNASAMQCFLKSPRGGKEPVFSDQECQMVADYCQKQGLFTIVHCSYLLNFAKDLTFGQKYQLESLVNDCNNAARMGMHGVVFHIGKKLELDYEVAVQFIVENLKGACQLTNNTGATGQRDHHPAPSFKGVETSSSTQLCGEKRGPRILLETTAGQGSEVGWNLEELADIFNRLSTHHNRIGICVDTAHIFSGGADITSVRGVNDYFESFEKSIGVRHIDCIHLNDSLKPCESRVDRHMDIGKGHIGSTGLQAVVAYANRHNIPCILETPQKEQTWKDEILMIKKWVGEA